MSSVFPVFHIVENVGTFSLNSIGVKSLRLETLKDITLKHKLFQNFVDILSQIKNLTFNHILYFYLVTTKVRRRIQTRVKYSTLSKKTESRIRHTRVLLNTHVLHKYSLYWYFLIQLNISCFILEEWILWSFWAYSSNWIDWFCVDDKMTGWKSC